MRVVGAERRSFFAVLMQFFLRGCRSGRKLIRCVVWDEGQKEKSDLEKVRRPLHFTASVTHSLQLRAPKSLKVLLFIVLDQCTTVSHQSHAILPCISKPPSQPPFIKTWCMPEQKREEYGFSLLMDDGGAGEGRRAVLEIRATQMGYFSERYWSHG